MQIDISTVHCARDKAIIKCVTQNYEGAPAPYPVLSIVARANLTMWPSVAELRELASVINAWLAENEPVAHGPKATDVSLPMENMKAVVMS